MPYANVNGTRLYYETKGKGPAVTFLHGWTLDTAMWDDQYEEFSKQYKVLRYDLCGYGKSETPKVSYAHHEDLKALLDYLKIDKTVIIGLSMGGYVATNFAIVYPNRVSALITVDAIIEGRDLSKELNDSFTPIFSKAKSEGVKAGTEEWLNHAYFAPARRNPNCAGRLREIVERYSGWEYLNDDMIIRLSPKPETRLNEIRVPTLVVIGELDLRDCQEHADVLATRISGAEKVVIKGAGHMSNMEKPDEFNRTVLDFLKKYVK